MTDQQHHPITPSPELVRQWTEEDTGGPGWASRIATRAAQWGYEQRGEVNEAELQKARDEELEACCKWTAANFGELPGQNLHLFRRPKPPSLAEQARKLLECYGTSGVRLTADQCNTILRALKALPNG